MGLTNESGIHSQDSESNLIAYIIIEILLSFFATFNNTLVLVAIYKFKNLRTRTYILVGSLAVADIAVALLASPSGIVLRKGLEIINDDAESNNTDVGMVTQASCSFFVSSVLIFTQVSIFNMLAIAVDRFIAIHYSLRYKSIVTTTRLHVTIALTWIFGAGIGFIPHWIWYAENQDPQKSESHCEFESQVSMRYMVYLNFFTFSLLPLAVMFVLYYVIFKSAKRQIRNIYRDVLQLSKKQKSSLSSLKEIFKSKELIQHFEKKKKSSIRKRFFSNGHQESIKLNKRKKNSVIRNASPKTSYSPNDDALSITTENSTKDFSSLKLSKFETSLNSIRRNSLPSESGQDCKHSNTSLEHIDKNSGQNPEQTLFVSLDQNGKSLSLNTISSVNTVALDFLDAFSRKKNKLKTRSKYLKKEFKAARSLLAVVGVFAICWLPLHVHNSIHYFNPELSKKLPVLYPDLAILLSHANSLINPIIYAFQLSDMRAAFRKLFKSFFVSFKKIFCCNFLRNEDSLPTFV